MCVGSAKCTKINFIEFEFGTWQCCLCSYVFMKKVMKKITVIYISGIAGATSFKFGM